MVNRPAPLPALSPEERKAQIAREIQQYAAAWAAASPAERELATLEMKTRLTADELARMADLRSQIRKAA